MVIFWRLLSTNCSSAVPQVLQEVADVTWQAFLVLLNPGSHHVCAGGLEFGAFWALPFLPMAL